MADTARATAEVARSRRRLFAALFGILVVAGTIVGVMFATGMYPLLVDELLALGPVRSEEETETVSTSTTETVSTSTTETVSTSTTETVSAPPGDAQEAIYWEQVWSREQITDLATDRYASFQLGDVVVSDETADIRVSAVYRDGSEMGGRIVLRRYEGRWYFATMTRDGQDVVTPGLGAPDAAVVKVISEQQAANQAIYRALVERTHTTITFDKVKSGSGTAVADITLSGVGVPEVSGQITCIRKSIDGATHWFIAAFSEI